MYTWPSQCQTKHPCLYYNVYILIVNNHCLPIADTGDCTEGVTVTVIGVLDDPPVILTITSINPDDSEPKNCPDANSTANTTVS